MSTLSCSRVLLSLLLVSTLLSLIPLYLSGRLYLHIAYTSRADGSRAVASSGSQLWIALLQPVGSRCTGGRVGS